MKKREWKRDSMILKELLTILKISSSMLYYDENIKVTSLWYVKFDGNGHFILIGQVHTQ
jgi:hypothetical protein